MNDLEIKIAEVSHSGGITVKVSNGSKNSVKVWQESNSWGAARWRILRIRKGELETFFQNPNQRFTRNIPTSNEIALRAQIEQKLDLNGGNWCGFSHCSSYNERGFGGREVSFEMGDIVVVVYDVPRTEEATRMSVWYGATAALTTVQYRDSSGRPSPLNTRLLHFPARQRVRLGAARGKAGTLLWWNMRAGEFFFSRLDPVGNRLSSQLAATYSYNSSNEVTAAGTATYTYDDNGNTLTKTDATGTTTYNWDFENRLVSAQLPSSSTVNFEYDPFGRRIEKGTSVFVYDGANLIEESDTSGNTAARYAYGRGIDEPLAAYRGQLRLTTKPTG
jgi:YD repeat-containing protein